MSNLGSEIGRVEFIEAGFLECFRVSENIEVFKVVKKRFLFKNVNWNKIKKNNLS